MDPRSFARPSLPCPVRVTSSANVVAEQPSTPIGADPGRTSQQAFNVESPI